MCSTEVEGGGGKSERLHPPTIEEALLVRQQKTILFVGKEADRFNAQRGGLKWIIPMFQQFFRFSYVV
jgi:hypothetical protein